jgi:hypothetical protein
MIEEDLEIMRRKKEKEIDKEFSEINIDICQSLNFVLRY